LLVAAVLVSPTLAKEGRFRLRELYPQEKIEKVLVPRGQWHPWPKWSDRRSWESLPEPVRRDLVASGEQYLGYKWPNLPAMLFLEYARNGNRSRYEHEHFARREALTDLIVAECVEGKGRFLDDIVNGVWAICEESFWGVPAQLQLDIAAAYPKQANVKSWVRTIRLNRGKDIGITENFTLDKPAKEITLTLLTPCKATVQKDGQLLLETVDGAEPRTSVRVLYDEAKLKPVLEAIPIEDGRLRSVWPEQLTRILLKAETPALQDRWTVRIESGQSK
jgi:hypothetical protein